LIILNNPYGITNESILTVFLNGAVVYFGKYASEVQIEVPNSVSSTDLIHLSLELIVNDQLFIVEDKSVFLWNMSYKYIYCGFFPGNDEVDKVHFLPQTSRVVQ